MMSSTQNERSIQFIGKNMVTIELLKTAKWKVINRFYRRFFGYSEDQFERKLSKWYLSKTGRTLSLDNPVRFNEKIQWIKLYNSTPLKARLADKYNVREWIRNKIGEEYLIPLLGVWKSFDEIDYDSLPASFVLKTNHASGTNIIVKEKKNLSRLEIKLRVNRWMSTNYAFKMGLELHYGMIEPLIICEKYMGENLKDFKLFCFNGEPEFFWVDVDRFTCHSRYTFDLKWNSLPFVIKNSDAKTSNPGEEITIEKPQNINKMIEISRILAKDFCFVRIDFYEIEGQLYFGEMTFTSSSGVEPFIPDIYDYYYGEKLILPPKGEIPIDYIKKIWNNGANYR